MRDHEGRSNEQRTPNECRGIVLIPVSHPKTQKRTNALDISVPIISVFFFFGCPVSPMFHPAQDTPAVMIMMS